MPPIDVLAMPLEALHQHELLSRPDFLHGLPGSIEPAMFETKKHHAVQLFFNCSVVLFPY